MSFNLNDLQIGGYKKHNGVWYCRVPTNEDIELHGNLSAHDIIENEDGTITVSPSILVTTWDGKRWHGYLKNGIWERLGDSNV